MISIAYDGHNTADNTIGLCPVPGPGTYDSVYDDTPTSLFWPITALVSSNCISSTIYDLRNIQFFKHM